MIEAADKAQVITGRPLGHRLLRHGWHRALAARGTQRGNHALAGLRRRPADSSPAPPRKSTAICPDGQGDVTKTHVVWTCEDNVPDVTSPLSNGDLIFMLTTAGMLTCLDAKDGKKQWDHDYDMEFHASPECRRGAALPFQPERHRAGRRSGSGVQGTAPHRNGRRLSRQPGLCPRPDLPPRRDECLVSGCGGTEGQGGWAAMKSEPRSPKPERNPKPEFRKSACGNPRISGPG